jgi:quinol monooxygenase YgiN
MNSLSILLVYSHQSPALTLPLILNHVPSARWQAAAHPLPICFLIGSVKMKADKLVSIAVLKAKVGMGEALRRELLKLIEPTRREPGNLDYVLFELKEEPSTFYMREAFTSQAALDEHCATDYFQAFARQADELLAEPLRLIFLEEVSPSPLMAP